MLVNMTCIGWLFVGASFHFGSAFDDVHAK